MKKFLTLAVGLGLVFTIAGTASAAISNPSDWADGALANGVVNSRHNLGSTGLHFSATNDNSAGNTAAGGGGTSEVCIFCHTPHHGTTNAPLWNKGAQTTTYTTYGTTLGGTSADTSPGAVTLACLSCHDGVNSFDTIVNWPGHGTQGVNDGSGTSMTTMPWLFTEGAITQSDYMTSGRINLGTNLTNDHPVSITYNALTAASLRATSTVISTVTMTNDSLTVGVSTASATDTRNRWSVAGYIKASATIGELLRSGKVECASCHDPHFKNQSWDEVAQTWGSGDFAAGSADMDGLFLRRVGGNSLSGVCRTCHGK